MSQILGIAHALPADAEIIHTRILGKNSLGRISDLVNAWCKNRMSLPDKPLGDLRILIQALLEFSCKQDSRAMGLLEAGYDQHLVILATRFELSEPIEKEQFAKQITHWWLNSEDITLFKRILFPHDRVEVRYQVQLNLIEWRVYRSTRLGEAVDHNSSFQVLIDESNDLQAGAARYQDLGDLPYQEWLAEVYRARRDASKSGEVISGDGVGQDDSEWARVVVEQEESAIDEEIRASRAWDQRNSDDVRTFKNESEIDDRSEARFSTSGSSVELEEWKIEAETPVQNNSVEAEDSYNPYSENQIRKLLSEQGDLKHEIKQMVLELKQKELKSVREVNLLEKKIKQFENLVRRKELVNQRSITEMKVLQAKLEQERRKKKSEKPESGDQFRDKALEMFEMLKRVKEENQALESMMIAIKQREKLQGAQISEASSAIAPHSMSLPEMSLSQSKQVDELNKKVERLNRALESEKQKVKALSERITTAQKEAQSAGPIIDDLQTKVEHTLKIAQQHKKETEAVKQKLVQADAEKNKVKNELTKAQAQIQTLTKRLAA